MLAQLNKKLHTPAWLFVLLLAVLILRIPTLFEPYSYGDEMIYLTLGEGMRQGLTLYSQIHDNKPPLLYLIAAIAGNLFFFRAILCIWSLATIYIFYRLADALFPKNIRFQKVATFALAVFTTLPFWEGNIANAELFMIGPVILAFLIIWTTKNTPRNLFLAGILFSIGALFKIPSIFDLPAVFVLWLVTFKKFDKSNVGKLLKNSFYLIAGVALPILLTFAYYAVSGAFKEYLIAAYLQNVGYLSSFRPGDVQKPFYIRNFPLLLRGTLVLAGISLLFWKRNKLSKQFILASAWLVFTMFAVTLSERPYPHYLIQAAPPASLLIGMFFSLNNIEQILVLLPLSLLAIVPKYYHFWGYPTLSYYKRFVNFAAGNMNKEEYISSFGGNVSRSYKIAEYIDSSTTKSDRILVWGDSSLIYALSKRLPPIKYVAGYHINDFSGSNEVLQRLLENPPLFVVILPGENMPPGIDNFIKENYAVTETFDGATVWKLLSIKLRSMMDYKGL